MGTYYRFVNDVTEERVELDQIDGGNIKWSGVIMGAAARIFTYLVMTAEEGTWHILGDNDARRPGSMMAYLPAYYECGLNYTDITAQVIEQYNECCSDKDDQIKWRSE